MGGVICSKEEDGKVTMDCDGGETYSFWAEEKGRRQRVKKGNREIVGGGVKRTGIPVKGLGEKKI